MRALHQRLSAETLDALSRTTELAEERIGSIRTVRMFAKEAAESGFYADRYVWRWRWRWRRRWVIMIVVWGEFFWWSACVMIVIGEKVLACEVCVCE